MNEIKQASIYMRVLWFNDNENLRPNELNVKLEGEVTDEVTFSVSKWDNYIGDNAPWETYGWANGITYDYKKEPIEIEETDKIEEQEQIINDIPYVIPSVIDIPANYRCNILKNAETEEYAYYTIKMTYVAPKVKKLATRSAENGIEYNGMAVENIVYNDIELDEVYFNNTLVFKKQSGPTGFAALILQNSVVNDETPDFSLTATTDEGMFKTEDNDGTSYYFRGAVLNNYVKFAKFWWRIIRINGDGTIRLIYDGTTGHKNGTSTTNSRIKDKNYNLGNNSAYVGWTYIENIQRTLDGTSSAAKIEVDDWYNTIENNAIYNEKVANGKFCNDRSIGSGIWSATGNAFEFAAYNRIITNENPSLLCLREDEYKLKDGLITADEVIYAGATKEASNTTFYLNNGNDSWTMTPSKWSGSGCYMFVMYSSGRVGEQYVANYYGLRPIINLQSDIEVTGTGTIDDPYVVVGAE